MTTYERPFGRSFEDFEVGDIYRHWPGKTITEYDDHLFCLLTMNHHPLHINEWFAENETVHHKNVVVGNLVYSLVLGMSVPDVSGSCIANLEVESLDPPFPHLPRGHDLCRDPCDRQGGPSSSKTRPRHRHRRDKGLQPTWRGSLLLSSQAHGVDARRRAASSASLRGRRLGLTRLPAVELPVGTRPSAGRAPRRALLRSGRPAPVSLAGHP